MNLISKHLKDKTNWLPLLFSFVMITKVLGFPLGAISLIPNLMLIIMAAICCLKGQIYNIACLAFLVYIPIEILLSNANSIFSPWGRFFLFSLVFAITSPLFQNEYAIAFRRKIFSYTLLFCAIISAISFCCYFLGINLMVNFEGNTEYLENTAGAFGGICSHSMLLAPISGIGFLYLSYQAITSRKKWIWAFAICCLLTVLFAASRSALIATIVGFLILLYKTSDNKSKYLRQIATISFISLILYPIWSPALSGIKEKNNRQSVEGKKYGTRDDKWRARILEFKEKPIYGIGFANVDPDLDQVGEGGVVEPGSSWLFSLSSLGVIGFSLFCIIFFSSLSKALFVTPFDGALYVSLIALISIHMTAEGYIFSGGNFMCFFTWLVIGCSYDCRAITAEGKFETDELEDEGIENLES